MGHVYLLKARRPWNGKILVKIGMTSKRNVHDRVGQIQQEWLRDRQIRVDYVASFVSKNPGEDESKLHREWNHRSVYGKEMRQRYGGADCSGDTEWFAVSSNEFRSLCGSSRSKSNGSSVIVSAIVVLAALWVLFLMAPKKPIQKYINPIAPTQWLKSM